MKSCLSTIYLRLHVSIVIGFGASLSAEVHAQAINETPVIQQLRELKELCDGDLVSPEVCIEKQRRILDLDAAPSNTPARAAVSTSTTHNEGNEASAQEIHHSLGLSFTLPDGWQSVNSEELQAGFDFLENQMSAEGDAKRKIQQIESSTQVSGTELFRKLGTTLVVSPQEMTLKTEPTAIKNICQRISKRMPPGSNRVMYDCRLREIGGYNVLYIEHDGHTSDMRTMIYMAAIGPSKTIQFILGSRKQSYASDQLELNKIISSLRWD